MSTRYQAFFWLAVTMAFLATIWVLGDMLLPFIVGMAVAYLLGPVVGRMIRAGVPRGMAALLILLLFFAVITLILLLIMPFAYREAVQLAMDLPQYADKVQENLAPYIDWLQDKMQMGDLSGYQETLKNNIGQGFRFLGSLMLRLMGGGQAIAGFVTFMVITPIVAFLMMEEWVRITKWIDDMIPRRSYATIRDLLTQMDKKISGFVRGQVIISCALAVAYAIALTIAGLKFGFLIGLMAGLLSVIPMVGSMVGLVVAILVAWFQSHELSYVGIIAAIFLVGQFLEGNIITPRIMGQSVGLHPLWILFALLAGGALFGIAGMLLAVPVAAVIGVLATFAITQYKASPYYGGSPATPAIDEQKKTDEDLPS